MSAAHSMFAVRGSVMGDLGETCDVVSISHCTIRFVTCIGESDGQKVLFCMRRKNFFSGI